MRPRSCFDAGVDTPVSRVLRLLVLFGLLAGASPCTLAAQEASYEVRDTSSWYGALYGGGLGALYRNGAFVDSIDLGSGVQHTPAGIIYDVVSRENATSQLGCHPRTGICVELVGYYLYDGHRKTRLNGVVPRFHHFLSTPVVYDSVLYYWGIERDEDGVVVTWAMRHDFEAGRTDSLRLGRRTFEGDVPDPLGEPERAGGLLRFGRAYVTERWRLAVEPARASGPASLDEVYKPHRNQPRVHGIRILRLRLEPGASTQWVAYRHDVLHIVIQGGRLLTETVWGDSTETRWETGAVIMQRISEGLGVSHRLTNLASTPIDAVALEYESPEGRAAAIPDSLPPDRSPDERVVYEDERVRVSEVRLAGEAQTNEHSHQRPRFMLFLSDALLGERGVPETVGTRAYERRRGDLVWREAPLTHILKNLTREPVRFYEIEVRPP